MKSRVSIESSTFSFTGNLKTQGGALEVENSNLTVKNTHFKDIKAHIGGSLSLQSSEFSYFEIENCTFENSFASVKGGAIYYN